MSQLPEPGGGLARRQQSRDASQAHSTPQEKEYNNNTVGGSLTIEIWTRIEVSLINIKEGLEKEGVGL